MTDVQCELCGLYKNRHTEMGRCTQATEGSGFGLHRWKDGAAFDVVTHHIETGAHEGDAGYIHIQHKRPLPIMPALTTHDMDRVVAKAKEALVKADAHILSTDSRERKDTPIYSGVLAYFPRALAYVARVSKAGNDKHNPGQPLHWSKDKSNDHADCIARHLIEQGSVDPEDGLRHSGKLAWRALALLEIELEKEAGK